MSDVWIIIIIIIIIHVVPCTAIVSWKSHVVTHEVKNWYQAKLKFLKEILFNRTPKRIKSFAIF